MSKILLFVYHDKPVMNRILRLLYMSILSYKRNGEFFTRVSYHIKDMVISLRDAIYFPCKSVKSGVLI